MDIYDKKGNKLTTGCVDSPYDCRDYTLACGAVNMPKNFQLVMPPVKNQFASPTCVAFSTSYVNEYYHSKVDQYIPFSTQFIYGYRPNGYYIGDGMVIRDALKTILKVGNVCAEDCIGNSSNVEDAIEDVKKKESELIAKAEPYKITSYCRVESINDIKTALLSGMPILASMNWYNQSFLKDGIYVYNEEYGYGRHCITIYGYNEQGWLVQNSWGKNWGINGKFILPYEFELNEAWAVSDNNDETIYKKKSKSKFANIIFRIWNFFVNFFQSLKK